MNEKSLAAHGRLIGGDALGTIPEAVMASIVKGGIITLTYRDGDCQINWIEDKAVRNQAQDARLAGLGA